MKAITSAALVIAISLLLALSATAAQDIKITFENANIDYSKGDYQSAILKYKEILSQSGYSSSVLFNLANSYARNNQIGKAVLNYERALLISPSDSDISGNLELVKKESGLFLKEHSQLERFLMSLTLDQWALLVLAGISTLAALYLSALFYPISRKTMTMSTLLCCLMLSIFIAGCYAGIQKFNPSIVISPEARLLISPFETAASAGTIKEGRRVYPIKTYKTYTYVTDETTRKGWIATASIEAVAGHP